MRLTGLAILPLALALASCTSTSRFDNMFGSSSPPAQPVRTVAEPEPLLAAPTETVEAQPLPPVAGDVTTPDPGAPAATSPTRVAALPPTPAPTPTSAGGIAGNWKITDGARGNCSITLTRQPLLDVYRATPSGCQAGSLAKVSSWQQRGQEINLLEPGGRTAVRLFPTGDGAFEGAATTSGARIRMAR